MGDDGGSLCVCFLSHLRSVSTEQMGIFIYLFI